MINNDITGIPGGNADMLKRPIIFFILAALTLAAAGCGENSLPADETTPTPADITVSEDQMPVLGRNGAVIGGIDSRALCTAADAGIFYSVFVPGEYEFTADAEYRFFNKEDGTDSLLGTLEGQGYEAYYTRTELDGRIYTLAIKGRPGNDSVPLMLLAFDPSQKTMKTFTVSENGFPYADMAAADGKLLIMNHEMSGLNKDGIYCFDPANEKVAEVLSFSSGRDSLRGIASAEGGFYLLRLKIGSGGANEMFVDLYGNDFVRKSEQSVNETMVKAIMTIPGMLSRQDAKNEIGMSVSHFSVADGRYMIYENFGMARIIADLETGETLLAKEDLWSVSPGSGSPVVYHLDFDNDDVKAPEITGFEGGKLKSFDFTPSGSHKMIRLISRSASGTWVVTASDDSRSYLWTQAVYLWTEQK